MSKEILYCAYHPDRETTLRCNRCGKPICASCAIRVPTGYRCKDCVRELQKRYELTEWYDFVIAFVLAAVGSFLASLLVFPIASIFFFGLLLLFYAPFAGGVIASLTRWALRNHHSRALHRTATAGLIVGGLPSLIGAFLPFLLAVYQAGIGGALLTTPMLLPAVWEVVYLALAVPAFYARLTGIVFKF
jgi:hypothetical protein